MTKPKRIPGDVDITIGDLRFLIVLRNAMERPKSVKDAQMDLQREQPGIDLYAELEKLEVKLGGVEGKGKLLLDRVKGRDFAVLTPLARDLAQEAQVFLEQFSTKFLGKVRAARKRVNVAMTNALTASLLSRVLIDVPDILEDHPTMDLKVIEADADELAWQVALGNAHFALGPVSGNTRDCKVEKLCKWKRVLLYNTTVERHKSYRDMDLKALQAALADEVVIVPPRRIMPELDAWLPRPRNGRVFKLPQASLRQTWVQSGLGVAISHQEKLPHDPASNVQVVDLSSVLGETEMCFYFRQGSGKLPRYVHDVVDAIRRWINVHHNT